MNEPRDSYLLPCTCGRNVVVEPRQAGETVPCQCGRTCSVPTMGEIRRLRPAEKAAAAAKSQWGSPQRFLLVGSILILLAGIAAAVLWRQYPSQRSIETWIQRQQTGVRGLKPWDAIQYYRRSLAPGVEIPDAPNFQRRREILTVGLIVLGVGGTFGAVLAGIGIVGLMQARMRKRG